MSNEEVQVNIETFELLAEEIKATTNKNEKKQKKNQLYKNFIDLLSYCTNLKKIDDLSMSEITIDLLEMYVNKYKCDEIFDTAIDCQLLILYGKAFLQQLRQKHEKYKNKKSIENLCLNLTKIEKLIHNQLGYVDENFFLVESPMNPQKKQIFGQKPFQNLNYTLIYTETLLQNTAFHSQVKEHELALEKATKCFYILKMLFKALEKVCDYIVMLGPENLKQFNFSSVEEFQNIHKYIDFICNKIDLPKKEDSSQWEPETGDWKIYKENLEKHWLSKLKSHQDNDYLVPKFNSNWISDFHISNIVKLKKTNEFLYLLKSFKFNQDFLLRCILVFSCCVFSIAAENRSISSMMVEQEQNNSNSQFLISKKNSFNRGQIEKYIKKTHLIQIENFVLSKLIHNKAVEILMYGFPQDIRLLIHFKETYKKHYFNIDVIPEVQEPSHDSIKYSHNKLNNYEHSDDEETKKSFFEEIQNLKNKIIKKMIEKKGSKSSRISQLMSKNQVKSRLEPDKEDETLFVNKSTITNKKQYEKKLTNNIKRSNQSFELMRIHFQKATRNHHSGTLGMKSQNSSQNNTSIHEKRSTLNVLSLPIHGQKKRSKKIIPKSLTLKSSKSKKDQQISLKNHLKLN